MDAKDLPDLDHVEDVIEEARDAEEELLKVSPNSINPDDEDHDGAPAAAPADNPADTPADSATDEPADESTDEVTTEPRVENDEPG